MDAQATGSPNWARLLTASGATSIVSPNFAQYLDSRSDPLTCFRKEFCLPSKRKVGCSHTEGADEPAIYFCGNSLGLMPRRTPELIAQELVVWSEKGVLGHFDHPLNRPWKSIDEHVTPTLARLVGARQSEVACMGTLTANLHHLMASFYKPTAERFKILFEEKCFPSDMYAFASQAQHHRLTPDALIPLGPRPGEYHLRTEDILAAIENEGPAIALVMFSGVQYYTGQCFDMQRITAAARAQGCTVGFDLAHAIGNVVLRLHEWDVDFAVWCSYKYLCGGPGTIAGLFVHERHAARQHLAGWWGHNRETRFEMPVVYDAIPGAAGFQLSNPCVISTMSLLGALQIFGAAGGDMTAIRRRSDLLTGYLDTLLRASSHYVAVERARDVETDGRPCFTIITPAERGAQLSLLFLPSTSGTMRRVFHHLADEGVVGDERDPDVIRLAPVALWNTFGEVREAAMILESAMDRAVGGFEAGRMAHTL